MSYRDDVDALAARHTALGMELDSKTRELNESSRQLDAAKARARLPVLDNIVIATPCCADWNQMLGDDRVRACAKCEKQVFNLSSMTRDEAEALIVERNGDLCGRYYQRTDGTILLADCLIGGAGATRRKLALAGAAALLASGAAYAMTHRTAEPGFDSVSVAPAAEITSPHVAGTVKELPPPPPTFALRPVVIEAHEWHVTGGAVAVSADYLDSLTLKSDK
jgi:hypothetical protein